VRWHRRRYRQRTEFHGGVVALGVKPPHTDPWKIGNHDREAGMDSAGAVLGITMACTVGDVVPAPVAANLAAARGPLLESLTEGHITGWNNDRNLSDVGNDLPLLSVGCRPFRDLATESCGCGVDDLPVP